MPSVELPLAQQEYRRYALNQHSFLVDVDSLRPHPLHKRFSVPMAKEEYDRLKESIRKYGVRVPLTIWESQILGGVHRWRAAKELGMKHVPVLPLDLADEREAAIWIVRENLDRRQLTPGQRAMLAKALYELERERAAERRAQAPGKPRGIKKRSECASLHTEKGRASERAAKQVGIGTRTLEKAMKAVERKPELAEPLRRGEISVERAYRLAISESEKAPRGGRIPTVGPQVVITLPKQHFEWLRKLAKKFELKEKELAAHGLMEWLAAQGESPEPHICVRLPLKAYRALERLCRPADEPVAYLARFVLISVARHPEKYRELLAPVRVD